MVVPAVLVVTSFCVELPAVLKPLSQMRPHSSGTVDSSHRTSL